MRIIKTMQRLIEKNGFIKCGTIYVKNGTARIAYQRTDFRAARFAKHHLIPLGLRQEA